MSPAVRILAAVLLAAVLVATVVADHHEEHGLPEPSRVLVPPQPGPERSDSSDQQEHQRDKRYVYSSPAYVRPAVVPVVRPAVYATAAYPAVSAYPAAVSPYPSGIAAYPTGVAAYPTGVAAYPTGVSAYPAAVVRPGAVLAARPAVAVGGYGGTGSSVPKCHQEAKMSV
ncbi:hypothetical protein FOCC_FOCC017229 [Frankliniella occidentalis]|nr:hypothetical protein FOCC_FOCC017229 [Frankliniella occidentalis]